MKKKFREYLTYKTLKYLTILSLNIIIINQINSFGQSVVRSSLSCLGSTFSKDGFILRQTIGQSSNTFVFNNGGLVLIQGFQQPIYQPNMSHITTSIEFTLSPNPADEKSLLKFQEQISSYTITISNINGRVLTRIDDQTLSAKWLDLKNFMPGIYIVTVISNKNIGSKKLIINP